MNIQTDANFVHSACLILQISNRINIQSSPSYFVPMGLNAYLIYDIGLVMKCSLFKWVFVAMSDTTNNSFWPIQILNS